jgi:hypothetical protein
MSITAKVSVGAPESFKATREQAYFWTIVLILGVIVACAIGAWFYIDAFLVDASLVGP